MEISGFSGKSPSLASLFQPCNGCHYCPYIPASSKSAQRSDANWCRNYIRNSHSPLDFSCFLLFLVGDPISEVSFYLVYLQLSASFHQLLALVPHPTGEGRWSTHTCTLTLTIAILPPLKNLQVTFLTTHCGLVVGKFGSLFMRPHFHISLRGWPFWKKAMRFGLV